MKNLIKITILFTALFYMGSALAQFSLEAGDGQDISNKIVVFNTIEQGKTELHVIIHNQSSSSKKYRVEIEEFVNTSGDYLSLCVGPDCYPPFLNEVGAVFPTDGKSIELEAGEKGKEGKEIHVSNTYKGDDESQPVEYKFKVYEVDDSGNMTGEPVRFGYRFTENTAGFEDNQLIPGLSINQSMVNKTLDISAATELVNVRFYNLQGQMLDNLEVANKQVTISLANYTSKILFAVLTDKNGKTSTKKLINN